jgi:hypothetical protein
MEKKQTAVEWLSEQLDDIIPVGYRERLGILTIDAKQMFEEQIKDACKYGYTKDVEDVDDEWIEQAKNESVKYFEQTFKK